MENQIRLDKEAIIECSSIIENAPYVVSETDGRKYGDMYSLKCASCQSQNCAGPRLGLEKK